MRVYLTGATGFVGSNVAKVFAEHHGATLYQPAHRYQYGGDVNTPVVDLTDATTVHESVAAFRPDAVVHCAILNDFRQLYADRQAAWKAYVGATRNVVDAANAVRAKVVLTSTDWVFDGTQSGADETTPPNPVNLYGVLKFASELVVTERAHDGAVARLSGVNGVHWARPNAPRAQDAGFGYLVASIVDSLSAGEPFTVWESDSINMVATPSLASECAESMWRIIDRDRRGVHHCCGGEALSRRQLAELTTEVFGLDAALLRMAPPDRDALPPGLVPYDTSLDGRATAVALGIEPASARDLLGRLRRERETGLIAGSTGLTADTTGLTGDPATRAGACT
jgi:dTDP-4-dehydrorhamnose reductase